MQAEIATFTMDDKVYALTEAITIDIEERINSYGNKVVATNNDYAIMGVGETAMEATERAAMQLAMLHHIYINTPDNEMSNHAVLLKHKLRALITITSKTASIEV